MKYERKIDTIICGKTFNRAVRMLQGNHCADSYHFSL